MPSLVRKRKGRSTYLYVVRSARVAGKPRIVSQTYLGPEQAVLRRLESGELDEVPRPLITEVRDSAALHVLVDLAQRWGVTRAIDRISPRSRKPSPGRLLLVAAMNRLVEPESRAAPEAWIERTVLRERLELESAHLSSSRFWEGVRVDAQTASRVEHALRNELAERARLPRPFEEEQRHRNPAFVPTRAAWRWSEPKRRAHALYGLIAQALTALLTRELRARAVRASVWETLDELHAVREVRDVYPPRGASGRGRRRTVRRWTELSARQQQLVDALALHRHRPA